MKEQLENDIKRILKEKHHIVHHIEVNNVDMVGAHRRCSVKIGDGWIFDGIEYEALNGRGQFEYKPEYVAELMAEKILRYRKYGKK